MAIKTFEDKSQLDTETGIVTDELNVQHTPTTITPNSLKPATTIDFQTPEEPTVFPVADLDVTPPATLTAPEQEAQGITEQLQSLTGSLVGESSFRADQEKEQGLQDLQTTQTDLTAQLKAIQNEAKAIPLQLQQESEGRGITTGGLQPLQTARLRTNAIQALSVNSLLEASRGNISTAQSFVDRAVAQKYDPIREEIAVKTANLNLIINSPEYTLADKNRANKMKQVLEERQSRINEEEATELAVKNLAITAAQQGVDAVTLKRISEAKTEIEANQLLAEAVEKTVVEQQTQLSSRQGAISDLIRQGVTDTAQLLDSLNFDEQGNKIGDITLEEISTVKDLVGFEEPDLQFISGTARQQAGIFDKSSGKFTPIGGGGGGIGTGGGTSSGDTTTGEGSEFDYGRSILDANKDASPEELKIALLENTDLNVTEINSLLADRTVKAEAEAEANKPVIFSQEWFKDKIKLSRDNDFSDVEIVDFIIDNFDTAELFKTAKEAGFAKFYTGKETDIKRYINSLL